MPSSSNTPSFVLIGFKVLWRRFLGNTLLREATLSHLSCLKIFGSTFLADFEFEVYALKFSFNGS